MPSLFRKLLTPKQSSVNLKSDRRQLKSNSGGPSTHIKRWTSRNKKDGTSCSLPPELVLKILELAWNDDLSTAATSSLLCKSVLERTRRFLYTCPTLTSASQINLFLRSIKKNPSLASRVVGATLNGQNAGAAKLGNGERIRGAVTTRLPQLLELCGNLQELTVKRAVVFSLTDFSNANSLLHLTLDGCLLSDRTTTQRYQKFYTPLPNVSTLTLRSAEFDLSTADHFLCPRTLPSLVALELEGCKLVDNPSSLNDLGIYEPRRLASSLELLVLKVAKNTFPTSSDLATIGELLESCSNLRALQIEISYLAPRLLENLPLSLTHLALLVAPSPFPDLYQTNLVAAQALSTSFISLSVLSTSPSSHPTQFGTSSPSTPHLLTPFGSPGPSPPSQQYPLSELISLRLPRCWEPDQVDHGWKEQEFEWAVKRITRVCKERLVRVEYARREERKKGRIVRGMELRRELEEIRKTVPMGESQEPYLWR